MSDLDMVQCGCNSAKRKWHLKTLSTQEQVEYLKTENLLLREKLGTKRLRLTDAERRRLAMLGKTTGGRRDHLSPAAGWGK
jgi:hypothetical protein